MKTFIFIPILVLSFIVSASDIKSKLSHQFDAEFDKISTILFEAVLRKEDPIEALADEFPKIKQLNIKFLENFDFYNSSLNFDGYSFANKKVIIETGYSTIYGVDLKVSDDETKPYVLKLHKYIDFFSDLSTADNLFNIFLLFLAEHDLSSSMHEIINGEENPMLKLILNEGHYYFKSDKAFSPTYTLFSLYPYAGNNIQSLLLESSDEIEKINIIRLLGLTLANFHLENMDDDTALSKHGVLLDSINNFSLDHSNFYKTIVHHDLSPLNICMDNCFNLIDVSSMAFSLGENKLSIGIDIFERFYLWTARELKTECKNYFCEFYRAYVSGYPEHERHFLISYIIALLKNDNKQIMMDWTANLIEVEEDRLSPETDNEIIQVLRAMLENEL